MPDATELLLDRASIAAVDASDQLTDVLALPEHLRDALWKVESAGLRRAVTPGGLVVAGMGGSGIGGALARAALGDHASRPILFARAYGLPAWTTPDTTVLCASYSGDTEETLACFEAAGSAGAERVVLTTGGPLAERARAEGVPVIGVPSGMQPRAAVVYMTVGALECATLAGAAPPLREEVEAAAATLEELGADDEPDEIARALRDTLPVVYGAEITAAPARRWKTQLNENSKIAAFAGELPEANHNEIEGWRWGHDHAPLSAVFLTAPGQHPRVEGRIDLTASLLVGQGVRVVRAGARGDSGVAKVLSLVMLGDLVSVRLAQLSGVDPEPVVYIEGFKDGLGSP